MSVKSDGSHSDEESFSESTTEDTRTLASNAINKLVEKSKERYEKEYQYFLEWCNKNKITNYDEDTLLKYFTEYNMIKNNTNKSLSSKYSMLKPCLLVNDNVDISQYTNLISYIKSEKESSSRKSAILEEYQINEFLAKAPDRSHLMIKVALIMGISGRLGRLELCKLMTQDVQIKSNVIFVSSKKRQCMITNLEWIQVTEKYIKLRSKVPPGRFFLSYKSGKLIRSPVGINAMGRTPYQVAVYLNLPNPELYTGHCFRRFPRSSHTSTRFLSIFDKNAKEATNTTSDLKAVMETKSSTTSSDPLKGFLPGISILNSKHCVVNIDFI